MERVSADTCRERRELPSCPFNHLDAAVNATVVFKLLERVVTRRSVAMAPGDLRKIPIDMV